MSPEEKIAMMDRISSLPDELICHILSFLTTQDSIATSLLSKRWRHLWRSVPALDLSTVKDDTRFFEFIYSVLLLRDTATDIKKFQLKIGNAVYLDFPANINKWVNFATQRRVEHLHLDVSTSLERKPELPISIFSCRTLVVLKLKWFDVKPNFSTKLPSLKTLCLELVHFTSYRHLKEFLSGCPILEDLQLDIQYFHEVSLNFGDLKSLSLPKLIRANIDCPTNFPLEPFCNVKFLRVEIKQAHYDFPSFHNLTHLEIINRQMDKWELLEEMLNHCPKLQSLSLLIRSWRCSPESWTDPAFIPKCLSLNLKSCTFQFYEDQEGLVLRVARCILRNASVLRTMILLTRGPISQTQIKLIRRKLFSGLSHPKCKLIVHPM